MVSRHRRSASRVHGEPRPGPARTDPRRLSSTGSARRTDCRAARSRVGFRPFSTHQRAAAGPRHRPSDLVSRSSINLAGRYPRTPRLRRTSPAARRPRHKVLISLTHPEAQLITSIRAAAALHAVLARAISGLSPGTTASTCSPRWTTIRPRVSRISRPPTAAANATQRRAAQHRQDRTRHSPNGRPRMFFPGERPPAPRPEAPSKVPRPAVPASFTEEPARQKVQAARMPGTPASRRGGVAIPRTRSGATGTSSSPGGGHRRVAAAEWSRELDYALRKELWSFDGSRIAVRFQYESHNSAISGSAATMTSCGSSPGRPDAQARGQHQRPGH